MTDDQPCYTSAPKANPRGPLGGPIWTLRRDGRTWHAEIQCGRGVDLRVFVDGQLVHQRRYQYKDEALDAAHQERRDRSGESRCGETR